MPSNNRTGFWRYVLILVCTMLMAGAPASRIEVKSNRAEADFPDGIRFSLEARSEATVRLVELEHGLESGGCAADINLAAPEWHETDGKVYAEWEWDMYKTFSLPPGTRIWWRWHIRAVDGAELRTETQWITWLDSVHDWRALEADNITLYWYGGTEKYAPDLLEAAGMAHTLILDFLGRWPEDNIKIFLYENNDAMRSAVLFEYDWTGALSFSDHRIIIMGAAPDEVEWGKKTIRHELAHVAVHDILYNCYASPPTWLDEGIAMTIQGGLDTYTTSLWERAVRRKEVFPIRTLADGFSVEDTNAYLAYAQSYSIVQYLFERFGKEKLLGYLLVLRDGYRWDRAFGIAFGLSIEQMENEWREEIGVPPVRYEPLSTAGETALSTLEPLSGIPVSETATPMPTIEPPEEWSAGGETGEAILAMLLCSCLGILFIFAGTGVLFVIANRRRHTQEAAP